MAAYQSTQRRTATNKFANISSYSSNISTTTAQNELDSHADTCALGSNFVPLHYTGRVCDVSPYNSNTYHPERDVPIVTGATAYTDQATGQVYILVINEGLWFGQKLTNSLINPNQLRYAGVAVQDNPFHTTDPMAITHDDIVFPLQSMGTTIFFDTSTPSQYELDHSPHIILTLDTEWNPHTVQLAAVQSAEAEDMFGDTEPGLQQISSVYCFEEMAENLRITRQICMIDVEARKTFISKERFSGYERKPKREVEHRIEPSETNIKSYDAKRRQICDITCEPKVSD